MKKTLLISGLCGILFATGCQTDLHGDEAANDGVYHNNGTTMDVRERDENFNPDLVSYYSDNAQTHFGYVRHQADPIENNRDNPNLVLPRLNREVVADMISKTATTLPNVNDVATLITDEEVLIAYETDSTNREETATQVWKTANSIVPSYYHVYVSDNPLMIRDLERYSTLNSTDEGIDQSIDNTIQQMQQSPQGEEMELTEDYDDMENTDTPK